MKKGKIFIACTLAGALCAGTAGCSGTNGKESAAGKEKLTIAAWVTGIVKQGSVAERELEKRYSDFDFEFIPLERDTWQQQLNTRIAGGDIPDIIYRDHNYYVIEYVKQNLLAEIPFDMVKECAPDIMEASKEYGESVWLSCNVDGKNYGLPFLQPNQSHPSTDSWRMDWLKNVGIDKVPETIDEYEEAFHRFVHDDPDGNGVDDTLGLTYQGKNNIPSVFKTIFAAYGTVPNSWMIDENDECVYGNVRPQAKEALKTLSRWYAEGLIDPEFVTMDSSLLKQKWVNGKIGFMPAGTWYRMVPGGEHYEALKQVNPEAEIAMGPAPKGPDGSFGYGIEDEGNGAITSSTTFSKKLEENPEKLKKAVSIVNDMMSDPELYAILKYGEEGTNWKRGEHNKVEMIKPYNIPENCGDLGINFFSGFYAIPKIQNYYSPDNFEEQYKYAVMGNVFVAPGWISYFVDQEHKKLGENCQLILDKWFCNFIVGKEPLDKFDDCVKEWYDAGGRELTEAYNEAYHNDRGVMDDIIESIN
ncbi:MAG: extracellular solute-binding protein [Clostridia bacterium]|nr:extracellular solute-binding protein [Clostridia bacterium]